MDRRPRPRPRPPAPATAARPAPPPAATRRYRVEEYDNGWFHAVDERGVEIIKHGYTGIQWPVTGASAKRVRERMGDELPAWEEQSDAVQPHE